MYDVMTECVKDKPVHRRFSFIELLRLVYILSTLTAAVSEVVCRGDHDWLTEWVRDKPVHKRTSFLELLCLVCILSTLPRRYQRLYVRRESLGPTGLIYVHSSRNNRYMFLHIHNCSGKLEFSFIYFYKQNLKTRSKQYSLHNWFVSNQISCQYVMDTVLYKI